MKKNIIIIIGCLLLLGCRQEVLEPEQMIQGMYALDDGSGLTNQYLLFDNGYLDIFSSDDPLPIAGKRIWSYDASLFKRDFKQHRYTISGNKIYTSDGPSGEIELKDDILTISGKKYSVLEGFERDPYSSIVVDEEVVVPFIGQENSFPYSIENPIPSGKLTVESAADWIQGLRVQNGRIVFNATMTTIERIAQIYLSYTKADPVSVAVKQSPSTFIRLENDNLSIDYTASRQTLGYSIENPLASSSLTATTTATWISTIQILDNEIIFDVSENNSGADRSATMTLSYEGAPDVTFTVTQQWLAPLITLTPSSETIDYIGGTFSFGYIVGNPRQGLSVNAVSQATWITDVSISGSTVTYKVAENNSGSSRTGKIRLTYGNLTTVYYNLTQTYSAPIIELTPSSIEVDYTGGTFSFGYSVTNSRENISISASVYSGSNWITDLVVSGETISYIVAENNSGSSRTGKIRLTYGNLTTVYYNLTQTYSAPIIELTPSSIEVDYTGGTFSFDYTVTNPRQGLSVNAVSQATWITDVSISGSTVTYKVAENNSKYSRTGKIRLDYGNLTTTNYTVTQTYAAPSIVLTPNSIEVDYTGGTFSFGYSVTNPRQDVPLEISSQTEWITIVNTSGNTVNYRIVANSGFRSRDGRINLKYGSYTSASYNVTQGGSPLPEGAVDLGLSVLWASCNLGASSPEKQGADFAWGETEGKIRYTGISATYCWSTYKWCNGNKNTLSKYNTNSIYGAVDNISVLQRGENPGETIDDAARAILGADWRMPTWTEFTELQNNCYKESTTINGVYGLKFTSMKSGFSDKWIFLPASFGRYDSSHLDYFEVGEYWSSSLNIDYPYGAYILFFSTGKFYSSEYGSDRSIPRSVRPVLELE